MQSQKVEQVFLATLKKSEVREVALLLLITTTTKKNPFISE